MELKNLTLCRAPALVALILMASAAPADAHVVPGPYQGVFPSGQRYLPAQQRQLVYFDDSFPGGRARDRIAGGAYRWTKLNRSLYFVVRRENIATDISRYPGAYSSFGGCPTATREGRRVSMIDWYDIDGPGGIGGGTSWCMRNDNGDIESFRIGFDRRERWYAGTGDSRVRNRQTGRIEDRVDMWSVATHEFGHATGWSGHFGGSALCNSGKPATFQTMCSTLSPGTELARTLGSHDAHTFSAWYPAR